MEEIHLRPLADSWNEVYRHREAAYQPARNQHLHKKWAQVFELGCSTQLICQVDGDVLQMNLIHWTDEALKQYI